MFLLKASATTAAVIAVSLPASAFAGGARSGEPAALKPGLPSHAVTWRTPGGGELMANAPKGWKLGVTKSGEGRFNDPTHTFLLAVAPYEGNSKDVIKEQVAELKGTPGLTIIKHTGWELTYSYDRANGARRWVSYNYSGGTDGGQVNEVAGRTQDVKGLQSVMEASFADTCGGGRGY